MPDSNEQTTAPDSDACQPVDLPDGTTVRVHGTGDLTEQGHQALGALVDAARRKFIAEHGERTQEDTANLNALYRERAHLVAYLAATATDAVLLEEAPDAHGWAIVFVTAGCWQMSWHIADNDLDLFKHVARVAADDPRAQWDGHTTPQKYARLRSHTRMRHMRRLMAARLDAPTTEPGPHDDDIARRFVLQRDVDVTGVSGTGIVAHGVMWPDGTASVRWIGPRPSAVFWDHGMADAEAVHGHGGATRIVWID